MEAFTRNWTTHFDPVNLFPQAHHLQEEHLSGPPSSRTVESQGRPDDEHCAMQKVLVEGLPEVLQQIFQHLDCEGVRKLAAVSPTIRNTSYRALAVAEFEAQHIRVKGLFQAFQISALRDGRKSWGSESSARAFKAAIDEVSRRTWHPRCGPTRRDSPAPNDSRPTPQGRALGPGAEAARAGGAACQAGGMHVQRLPDAFQEGSCCL
ncbi:hypothetical protein T484DRAFT_1902565, partial [Baffinella frigidus]